MPQRNGLYGYASGSSLSAAQCAGAAALLFEWAVVRGNRPFFTGSSVKNYLTRGAKREDRMQYPNREWDLGEWICIIRLNFLHKKRHDQELNFVKTKI